MRQFYAYTHARPDGSIFYVGKGAGRRAWDFSPTRRTTWHRNIFEKHGKAIQITVRHVDSEAEAFELERFVIEELRRSGIRLINLTDGGEGVSGRKISEATRVGLAKGRGKAHYATLPDEAKKAILDGLAVGRSKLWKWRQSEAGKAHFKKLTEAGNRFRAERQPWIISCAECGKDTKAFTPKAKFCGKICCQIAYRRRLSGC